MLEPIQWTSEQLGDDSARARDRFRAKRLEEPLELYTEFFDEFVPIFDRLIDQIEQLAEHEPDPDILIEVVSNDSTKMAFRYLTAPPISEDDLKTLANAKLSPKALRHEPDSARRVRDTVLHILDPKRFPWITESRNPDQAERKIATVASAALAAAQKVQTKRRNDAKSDQEESVKRMLRDMGFTEVRRRDIPLLRDAPAPGEFCSESKLGDTRADLVVGMFDHRVLALECKVSNSEVNSFKRVNHEAAGKARAWTAAFWQRQVVPGAVLSGVFNPENLATAQGEGLAMFWLHRLDDLKAFIETTRSLDVAPSPRREQM